MTELFQTFYRLLFTKNNSRNKKDKLDFEKINIYLLEIGDVKDKITKNCVKSKKKKKLS